MRTALAQHNLTMLVRARVCVRWNTFKKDKKNKLLSDALNKTWSPCSEHSTSCWGEGKGGRWEWGGGVWGVGGRGQVVQKMNSVFLAARNPLELVVPSQSFAEVGHLAADKQVVLVQDFRFGQTAVLMGDRTDIVSRVTLVVRAENS